MWGTHVSSCHSICRRPKLDHPKPDVLPGDRVCFGFNSFNLSKRFTHLFKKLCIRVLNN